MTETSLPWGGTVTGDATLAPYSDDEWSDMWRKLFTADRIIHGVLRTYANELAVSGATSPVAVATGFALVDGKVYENDAQVDVAVPTPGGATRIDRIVLRKDFAAQTIRITRIAGAEGGGAPAITQNDGVTWDVQLARVSITTAGTITVTDERDWVVSMNRSAVRYVTVEPFLFRDDEACSTGDGKGFIPIPEDMDGYRLVHTHAEHKTAGGGNAASSFQVRNADAAVDMLSTPLTIDAGETGSDTAAAPAVVNPANAVVSAFDRIFVDVDALDNTPTPLGLAVTLGFI